MRILPKVNERVLIKLCQGGEGHPLASVHIAHRLDGNWAGWWETDQNIRIQDADIFDWIPIPPLWEDLKK